MTHHRVCPETVSADRIADDLWRLVNIPSPTGQEQDVAIAYAEMLQAAGASVVLRQVNPGTPAVIGRLRGSGPGRIFQFAGHLDHIDLPHSAPTRDGVVISGRGAADMKNGLAGILEIIRVLNGAGSDFPGEILVTAYGGHEAPAGDSATLCSLIGKGIVGNAALVAEVADATEGKVVVTGAGQSIWNIAVRRLGPSCHELRRPPGADRLLDVVMSVVRSLRDLDVSLSGRVSALLPPESLFIGQLHYGDFYNRAPSICTLQGTRRWHPRSDFNQVRAELSAVLDSIPLSDGITVESDWILVGEAYEMNPEEPVVKACCAALQAVTGDQPVFWGTSVVTDANRLVRLGCVPAVLVGFDCASAHAEYEFVRIDRLLVSCKVALATAWNYLFHYA